MSTKEIKALARRWFEEWHKGKAAFMAVIDELHATDIVAHGGTGEDIRGLKAFKQECSELYNAFRSIEELRDINSALSKITIMGDRYPEELEKMTGR